MTVDELSDRVADALARRGAEPRKRAMAAMAALTVGRYDPLMRALEQKDMEPVILEDFVDYGYDLGLEAGEHRGLVEGERRALLKIFARRGLALTDAQRARIDVETSLDAFDRWLDAALTATSADEALSAAED
jgi:hypothetical protein